MRRRISTPSRFAASGSAFGIRGSDEPSSTPMAERRTDMAPAALLISAHNVQNASKSLKTGVTIAKVSIRGAMQASSTVEFFEDRPDRPARGDIGISERYPAGVVRRHGYR